MFKNNKLSEILQDPKPDGKERPWRPKKVRNLIIADSYKRLGEEKRANRVKFCGTYLEFTKDTKTGIKFLSGANFCRERLCPMCQWRRSLRAFYEVSTVMDEVQEKHKNLIPLFFTVTVRNCKAEVPELMKTLDSVFKGWNRFLDIRQIERTISGWFRGMELTYNKKTDEFHPHIHALILVDKKYFKGSAYMETAEWVQYWRSAMRIDYDPVCDIRRIKNSPQKRKGIAEVAKYTVKDTDFATADKAFTDRLVSVLSESLRRRRLYAFGGVMKQIAAKFGASEDLIKTGDSTIREDVATVIERYSWRFGLANYVKMK